MNFDMLAMQAFTGLSIFTILMLMALGLAIVFGLMGVINMAHGELMAMGAYCSYGTALLFETFFPGLMDLYLFVGIALAFVVTSLFGFLLERGLIRYSLSAAARYAARHLGREPDPAAVVSPVHQPQGGRGPDRFLAAGRVAGERGRRPAAVTHLHHRPGDRDRDRGLPAACTRRAGVCVFAR